MKENESKTLIFFERDTDCFHCEGALKEIRKVAERVDFEKVAFHRINCDDQPEVCKEEALRRFPTGKDLLFLFLPTIGTRVLILGKFDTTKTESICATTQNL